MRFLKRAISDNNPKWFLNLFKCKVLGLKSGSVKLYPSRKANSSILHYLIFGCEN